MKNIFYFDVPNHYIKKHFKNVMLFPFLKLFSEEYQFEKKKKHWSWVMTHKADSTSLERLIIGTIIYIIGQKTSNDGAILKHL
jgi:hypothetical protein